MATYANCTLPGLMDAWTAQGVLNARTVLQYNGSNLTLAQGEYPTGISLNADSAPVTKCRTTSYTVSGTYKANIVLCDSSGGNTHKFSDASIDSDQSYSSLNRSASGSWTDLNNKTLAIGKVNVSVPSGASTNMIYIDRYDSTYPEMTVTITTAFVTHAITWSNPSLSFSQNEYTLTVTKGGTATDNWGGTPTYKLYMDGADKGAFSGNTKAITLTDSQLDAAHTFALVAVSTARSDTVTSTGTTVSHTPKSVHKTVKYYTGSAWTECIMFYWTGSKWQEVEPYYWNGTQWVLCSHT